MNFEELLNRISPKLKGIIYGIHRQFYSFGGEDLYQEAVSNLWIDYQEGKLSDKTDSYILQSCYFYLKNYIRKFQDKTNAVSMNALINEEGPQLQDALLIEDEETDSNGRDIDALMEEVFNNGLSRKEKEVVFFYLQGWTTREIGERLGVSHVSVVKAQNKIRAKCKEFKDSR